MNANFMNFEKLEVTGSTKAEALEKAPFFIQGDATQAYKNWRSKMTGAITEADVKQFCLDYLAKKSKNAPNVGFAVTIDAAVADTRERPYTVVNRKNEKGKRKYTTTYQVMDKATGKVLVSTTETKTVAERMAKELYTKHDFKGDLICTYTKQVTEGEPVAFELNYTPSKAHHVGTYMVFGVKA
jgi:hypothetical protein